MQAPKSTKADSPLQTQILISNGTTVMPREVCITQAFIDSVKAGGWGLDNDNIVKRINDFANTGKGPDFKLIQANSDVYQMDYGVSHRILMFRKSNTFVITHIVHKQNYNSIKAYKKESEAARKTGIAYLQSTEYAELKAQLSPKTKLKDAFPHK